MTLYRSSNSTCISEYYEYEFDAAWALLLGLHDTVEQLQLRNQTLSDFTYDRKDIADSLYSNIVEQQFFGVTVVGFIFAIFSNKLL